MSKSLWESGRRTTPRFHCIWDVEGGRSYSEPHESPHVWGTTPSHPQKSRMEWFFRQSAGVRHKNSKKRKKKKNYQENPHKHIQMGVCVSTDPMWPVLSESNKGGSERGVRSHTFKSTGWVLLFMHYPLGRMQTMSCLFTAPVLAQNTLKWLQ